MRLIPFLMLPIIGILPGCRTAHDVAVTSFRVIDAPAAYIRRHVDGSETTTTTTTTAPIPDSDVVAPGRVVSSAPINANEEPVDQSGQRTVSEDRRRSSRRETAVTDSESSSSRRSRATSTEANPQGTPARTPRVSANASAAQVPTAKPVPGKAGYVFSPFDPNGGYVDVTGYKSGDKVKDPYSKKIFLVP